MYVVLTFKNRLSSCLAKCFSEQYTHIAFMRCILPGFYTVWTWRISHCSRSSSPSYSSRMQLYRLLHRKYVSAWIHSRQLPVINTLPFMHFLVMFAFRQGDYLIHCGFVLTGFSRQYANLCCEWKTNVWLISHVTFRSSMHRNGLGRRNANSKKFAM